MKLLALQMPSAVLAPPSENSSTFLSNHRQDDWYTNWCQTKVTAIEDYFHSESQRILRINDHQSSSSGFGSHITRLKKSKHPYLLQHLKFPLENTGDDDEGSEVEEDASVSSLGMESVQSHLGTLKKGVADTHKRQLLKKQSSAFSTSTSKSPKVLSPVKSATVSQSPLNSVVDIQGKVRSIHYNLASPHIFSLDALRERNKVMKELEAKGISGQEDSTSGKDSLVKGTLHHYSSSCA